MNSSVNIENKCLKQGVRLTDQRKLVAKVMSESKDHPDVDELHKRVSKLDSKISIATVYRTVKLFEEAGIYQNMILKVLKQDTNKLRKNITII